MPEVTESSPPGKVTNSPPLRSFAITLKSKIFASLMQITTENEDEMIKVFHEEDYRRAASLSIAICLRPKIIVDEANRAKDI